VVSAVLLVVGLIVGAGLTAWYFVEFEPLPADEERFVPVNGPPPGPPRELDRFQDEPD
jgi:hypothetical protein